MQVVTAHHPSAASVLAVHALEVLDTAPEPVFDALAQAAARACGVPIALISLLDTDRQWFKAAVGLPGMAETPREHAFCAHAVLGDSLFEVNDALLDPRFAHNPLVTGHPHIRFYAGMPVCLSDGERVGAICVIDHQPRTLPHEARQILTHLAAAVASALESRRDARTALRAEAAAAHAVTELAVHQERLRVTLQSVGDAVLTTDPHGNVDSLNQAAELLTGWSHAQAIGQPLSKIAQLPDDTKLPTLLRSRSGTEHTVEVSRTAIPGKAGVSMGSVWVLRDITAQRQLSAEVSFRATHDALTGLINRAEFETQLDALLLEARRDSSEHSVLFVDLDDFKLVNDAGGHTAGDQALQDVGKLLSASVRTRDSVARLDGDNFAVILRRCPAAQAAKVANKICEQLDATRFAHGERRFRIGTSIGTVPVDSRWNAIDAVIQAGESACRTATEAGGNRVHAWCDSDRAIQTRQGEMQWATRIEQALDENRFVLFAQRITPLVQTGQGVHAEVLLRMVERDGTLVPPGLFLPAAERYRLAQRVDRWVLSRAIAWLAACPASHRVDTLSVNLSGNSVGDRIFHRWAIDALTAAGADMCSKLCLEITETAAVTHMTDATAFVRLVRAAGVRVALDDFGAGAASFGYLKALPVDYLKIDGQFVRTLLTDPLDDVTVRCFVDVARVMGLKTVAEFVDQPAVLVRLQEIGVDYAQGFLLHRPAPIDALFSSPEVLCTPAFTA